MAVIVNMQKFRGGGLGWVGGSEPRIEVIVKMYKLGGGVAVGGGGGGSIGGGGGLNPEIEVSVKMKKKCGGGWSRAMSTKN